MYTDMSSGETIFSRHTRSLSREPDGRPQNLVFFGMAGLMYLVTVYAWTRGTSLLAQPFLGTVFVLAGVAESLPATRQQTAVRLRLLGLLLAGTATVVWVVELLGGPQLL
jgi:hypothetical protein